MTTDTLLFGMAGTWATDDPEMLAAFLAALESNESLRPTHWAPDERVSLPYSRAEVLEFQKNEGVGMAIVRRRAEPLGYEMYVGFGRNNFARMQVTPNSTPELRALLFEAADELCAILRPDYAAVNLGRRFAPWSSRDEMFMSVMEAQSWIVAVRYFAEGPRGLAMRTYFGRRYITQFPEGVLETVPCEQSHTDWGALRLDLAESPWALTPETALPLWRSAWEHIKPAEVTCKVFPFDDRHITFSRGKMCTIPMRPEDGTRATEP